LVLDLVLERIDNLVLFYRVLGKSAVASFQSIKGLTNHSFGKTAHFGDLVVEERELFLIGTDDVLVPLHVLQSPPRGSRRVAPPYSAAM
jgi:hypothetical protein